MFNFRAKNRFGFWHRLRRLDLRRLSWRRSNLRNKRRVVLWFAVGGVLMLAGVGGTLALNGFFGGGAAIPEDTMTRGLAGYWSFDEGDGTIARDASGNNNHGTLTNGPQWTKGKNGTALQFDGKDDYVDCGSTSSLNGISGVVSVEAWVRHNKLKYDSIVNKRADNVEGHWDFRHSPSGLQFVNFDSAGAAKITSASVTLGNDWHHLVVVATDSEVKIYMDGKRLATTGDLAPIISTSINVKIGSWGISNYYLNGQIDEVRIYNRALTEAEVKYHYNRGGPVAQWDMDEGSGSMINDKSGNGNNGTISGATWAQGKRGSALSFDGTDDYADAGNKDDLDITGSITIEAWVKPSGLIGNGAGHHIANKMTSWRVNGYDFRIGTGSADRLQFITDSSASDVVSTTILQNDSWYHVVAVQEGVSYKKIYINGVQDGLKSNPAALISSSAANLKIGTYLSGGEYFNGLIDEVKIYDYARTEEEIRLDYNAGVAMHLGPSGKTCSEDPAGCMDYGLAGHWDMDEGSGSMIKDKSGNNNDGTLTNGPKWNKGKNGTALQFDGKDDWVDLDVSNQPDYEYTITTWFYPKSNQGSIFYRAHCDGIVMSGSYLTLWIKRNNHSADNISVPISDVNLNSWNFVAATVNLRTAQKAIFINGKYVEGSTLNDDFPLMDMRYASIGYDSGSYCWGGKYFTGSIDQTFFYKRALSLQELRYHYNQGKPVAQWDMDEGSGSMIKDKSGNGNDGTIFGATWAQGKRGSALSFDGVDDYVNCGDLGVIGSAFTYEAWFKTISDSPYNMIVNVDGGIDGNPQLRTSGGKVVFRFYNGNNLSSALIYNDGSWHHAVGGINSSGKYFLYVDGINQGELVPNKTLNLSGNTRVGKYTNFGLFNGQIDEVKIYDYARTEEEIRLDYNAGLATHLGPSGKTCSEDPAGCMDYGLAGHWDMDEGSGSMIKDKSGNNNDGTLVNGPKWTQGKNGTALQFDGKDDYVNCGNNLTLQPASTVTLEYWMYPRKFSNGINERSVVGWRSIGKGIYTNLWNSDLYAQFWDGSAWQGIFFTLPSLNQWYHIVITYDASGGSNNYKIYSNGILKNQTTKIGNIVYTDGYFSIGNNTTIPFDGILDGMRLYNRALSAEEVRYHYNQGKPVAQWDFDEGEGTRAFDVSGNNNTGVLTNGPTWVEGKRGSALSFDGVDDSVSCGTDSSLNIADSMTASAWIYPKTLGEGSAGHIVGRGNTGGWVFYVYTGNSLKLYAGTTQAVSEANSITLNQWQYATVVYDKQNVRFFVNGIERGVTAATNSIVNTGSCVIGARTSAGDFDFNGYLDEVKIYNYARTEEQIMQDYNAGVATHLK